MVDWGDYEKQSLMCKDSSGLFTSRVFVYEATPYIAKTRQGQRVEIIPLYDLIKWDVTRVEPRDPSSVEMGVLESLANGCDEITVTLSIDKKRMSK